MNIGIIYARSLNNVIGVNNKLPWHIPEDLQHFKDTTRGTVIAMGRKTWESLPVKPLHGRVNVVLTSSPLDRNDIVIVRSIKDAINEAFYRKKDIWFIGGSNVINKALPLANKLSVTEVLNVYEGDAVVNDLTDDWREISRQSSVSLTGIKFNILNYERR